MTGNYGTAVSQQDKCKAVDTDDKILQRMSEKLNAEPQMPEV